jgi:hypothetical protein
MADFLSGFGSSLGDKVLPTGDALKRKIDSQRENWLKGISSTKHGKKEDPTYLHFRFIFDFGSTSVIDPETFLAPSPLFRPIVPTSEATQELNNLADANDGAVNNLANTEYLTKLQNAASAAGDGNFFTFTDFFYGSKMLINSRREVGAFPMNDGVAYMGAQQFLSQRSIKRQQMLNSFRNGLRFINEKCPYYFQSLSGLDQLLKVDIKNFHKTAGKPQRAGTLTVDCLESIDMRIFALSELYRKAIYDYTYHRTMLPENLRKFRMWIVVSEIRNIQLSYGINDVLNPFSIPSVAQAANFLDSFNSQTGLLDNTDGLLQKSTGNPQEANDKFGSYTLGPYAFIYQLDQCEFDFDDSYPSFSTIDNKGGSAVTNKFKIHVGKVKDYKIQFNELADIIQKDDNIKSMVLADDWGPKGSDYTNYDYFSSTGINSVDFSTKGNPTEAFAQMASNFITNSVADLKDQGVQIVQGALLGNIYGLGGINPGAAGRSAQSLINTLKDGVPNPFKDNTPQGQGLGGPGQRQYPTINEDAYTGVSSTTQQNLGTAYNGSSNPNNGLNEDVYTNNPGSDLGLPDRQYQPAKGDEYPNVPGSDSGVPGRVYPDVIKEDAYTSNPGADSGLPDRQYPTVSDDSYNNVPGSDLGVPARVYPNIEDDVYTSNPGSDLGLPDRQYPPANEDVYTDTSSQDTNQIGDVYPEPNNEYPLVNDKEYEEGVSVQVNNIGDVYPDVVNKYTEVNEKVYSQNTTNIQSGAIGDIYDESRNQYPGVNHKEYDPSLPPKSEFLGEVYTNQNAQYPSVNEDVYQDRGFVNGQINDDVYKGVPGSDLSAPTRNYGSLNSNEYSRAPQQTDVKTIGRVYPSTRNENNL